MWQERNIVNSTIEIIPLKNKKLGLNLDENTTAKEWAEIGKQLLVGNKMLNWCIGDWLVFGERKNFATLSSELGFDEGYLRNLKWIAKEFPLLSDHTTHTRHARTTSIAIWCDHHSHRHRLRKSCMHR
jgi:hypothetical protein